MPVACWKRASLHSRMSNRLDRPQFRAAHASGWVNLRDAATQSSEVEQRLAAERLVLWPRSTLQPRVDAAAHEMQPEQRENDSNRPGDDLWLPESNRGDEQEDCASADQRRALEVLQRTAPRDRRADRAAEAADPAQQLAAAARAGEHAAPGHALVQRLWCRPRAHH